MPYPTSVRQIVNGADAEQSVFNAPIQDLTQRTDYLLSLVQNLTTGDATRLDGVTVDASVVPGTPVYLDVTDGIFKPALGALDANSGYSLAADSSLWRGIAYSVTGTTGTVITGGALTLTTLVWADVLESGSFAAGRYFLSETEAGKLTTDSGVLSIYVGDLTSDGVFVLAGQGISTFLNHVHASVTLTGHPAGNIVADPGVNDPHVIDAPDAAEAGWLPANATYFPGFTEGLQIPTGAKFGYNIQHPDEVRLRSLFPPVPLESAQFALYGQVLDSTQIQVNSYGIWWMVDTYGDVPWASDYSTSGQAYDVTYWTVRIPSSTSFVDVVYDKLLLQLLDDFDSIGVRSLTTGASGYLTLSASKGAVEVNNDGVHALRGGHGIVATGTAGTAASGVRHIIRVEDSVEHQMHLQDTYPGSFSTVVAGDGVTNVVVLDHLLNSTPVNVSVFNETTGRYVYDWDISFNSANQCTVTTDAVLAAASNYRFTAHAEPKVHYAPISTNGIIAGGGTAVDLRGAVLADTGELVYLLHFGDQVPTSTSFRPTIRLLAAIDTPEAAATTVTVTIDVLVASVGQAISESRLVGTYNRSLNTGSPGVLQHLNVTESTSLGTSTLVVTRGSTLIVRVKQGGTVPVPGGQLRAVGAYVSLARVVA